MRNRELKQIVAALRQLPPTQRGIVALEPAALETPSTTTLFILKTAVKEMKFAEKSGRLRDQS